MSTPELLDLMTPVTTNLDRWPPKSKKRKADAVSSSPPQKAKITQPRRTLNSRKNSATSSIITKSPTATPAAEATTPDATLTPKKPFAKPKVAESSTRRKSARLAPQDTPMDDIPPHEESQEPEDEYLELLKGGIQRTNPVKVESVPASISEPLMPPSGTNGTANHSSDTPSGPFPSSSTPGRDSAIGSTQEKADKTLTLAMDEPIEEPTAPQSQANSVVSQYHIVPTGVAFFARIQTSKGPVEMQFPARLFSGDMAVLEAYRVFKEDDEERIDLGYSSFEKTMGMKK